MVDGISLIGGAGRPMIDFDEILAAARAGAEWAWTRIYRDFAPSVYGYLRSRGASSAEDITGETFLQLVRDLGSFEGSEAEFRAWLFAIARNRLIDSTRAASRRPVDPAPDDLIAAAGPVIDAEEEALAAIGFGRVRDVLRRLSTDQQDVLALRLFADLTVEQIAGLLGKSPGAVKALQHRGVTALKRELSKEGVSL